jgi:hypothetical protein
VDGKIVAVSQSKTPVQLLQAPYDSGHFALRMGAGPSALAAAGAADRLRAGGHDVREQVVAPTSSCYDPLGRMCQTALDLLELLADLVTPVPTAN